MGTEIERKFLVTSDEWKHYTSESYQIVQGYLSFSVNSTVRIRIDKTHKIGAITIKSRGAGNLAHPEYEYPIPYRDAIELLATCSGTLLTKTRHLIPHNVDDLRWEVDVFEDEDGNVTLTLAEIELPSEDYDLGQLPTWIGDDVSYNPQYYNSNMAQK